MNEMDKKHGSPYDRGSADRYYGRPRRPHYWFFGTGASAAGARGGVIPEEEMTPAQVEEYNRGYDEETDRKNWD